MRYARPRIRADAAIASRFNRVEPSHGQEAFASASTASPQLACRLAAPPGHESGLTPDTNGHEKLGVSTQGSGVGERNCFLFPFPIRVACEAGVFVCGEGRIRDLAGGESPKGWLWRSPSREGRWGKWVSCEWVSGGVGKRPSSGDGTRHRQSRLRDSPPGQGSWSRVIRLSRSDQVARRTK